MIRRFSMLSSVPPLGKVLPTAKGLGWPPTLGIKTRDCSLTFEKIIPLILKCALLACAAVGGAIGWEGINSGVISLGENDAEGTSLIGCTGATWVVGRLSHIPTAVNAVAPQSKKLVICADFMAIQWKL